MITQRTTARVRRIPRRRGRRGLTLVEVMVAIVILLVMSAIVAESLRNSIQFHNLLSDRDGTVRTARVALSRLKRDIQLAYLTPNRTVPDRFQTVFVGLDEEPDKLFFATLNHQRLYINSREADQTEVTVWAEASEDGPGYTLFHREAPRIDEEPDEQGVVWPLAYNVRSFRLRYLDQQDQEWKEEWDTRAADTPYRLPRAVEIGLVLIAPDPSDPKGESTVDVPFLTTVVLEYAQRLPGPGEAFTPMSLGGVAGAGANGLGAGQVQDGPFKSPPTKSSRGGRNTGRKLTPPSRGGKR